MTVAMMAALTAAAEAATVASRAAEGGGNPAYMACLSQNGLDSPVFPSVLKLGTVLISMMRHHFQGGPNATGNFTSGGTESIMLAVKSARDRARKLHPEITKPEILLPVTAHAAFHKAAHYLGLEVVLTAVDDTFRADVDAMRNAITDNTIMMVGSSPSYGHCVIDPISELGALVEEKGIWLHVDACVGGFLLPYYRRLGQDVPVFDFSVPGVLSISADFHKYGFCPKGASTVMYRDKSLRKHQIFACSEWTGYTIINTAVQSSKTGGPLAAAWAVIHYLGDEGYMNICRALIDGTQRLVEAIESVDGLDVMVKPDFCMVAASSKDFSIFHFIDEMQARGWYVQPQLSYANSKENVHFSLNPGNINKLDAMLPDLIAAVASAKKLPDSQLAQTVPSMFENAGPIADDPFTSMLQLAGIQDGQLPDRLADINAVLNALPRPITRDILIAFFNDMFM